MNDEENWTDRKKITFKIIEIVQDATQEFSIGYKCNALINILANWSVNMGLSKEEWVESMSKIWDHYKDNE